jgi:hypothetical protein
MPDTFPAFPKISRLNREWIITEKIDGTNALVSVSDDGETVRAGSRSKWITPADDNMGFAKWVEANAAELKRLGPGTHYGEWWGKGIQKRYGDFMRWKKFSLFNVSRWSDPATRPTCCDVVPVLSSGLGVDRLVAEAVENLRKTGSVVAPGCMKPEGVIAFHTVSGSLFKVLLENDAGFKGNS